VRRLQRHVADVLQALPVLIAEPGVLREDTGRHVRKGGRMGRSVGLIAGVIVAMVCGCVPSEPLVVSPSSLPDGAVGLEYTAELTADSEAGARWSVVEGELPAGLSLDSRSGVIGGTPEQAGEFSFTIQATDAANIFRTGTASYTVTILPQLKLAAALPAGRVSEAYSGSLSASGGVPPYTFSIIGLPAGLALDSAIGTVTGTPIYPVSGELLQVSVKDSGTVRQTATASVPLVIKGLPIRITTTSLPSVVVGSLYSHKVEAADGVGPYHWAIVAGDLKPLGLELVLSTGELRNRRDVLGRPIPIPAMATPSTFVVRVTDSDTPATTATKEFTVGVIGGE